MGLKSNWKDLIDGESLVEAEPINRIAQSVINIEEEDEKRDAKISNNEAKIQQNAKKFESENDEIRINVEINKASIENNRKNIASLASKVDRDDKRLTTIEAVVYGDLAQETEDNTVAYTKDVPANARGTAKLNTLGGMTRKCENLLNTRQFVEKTVNGVTFTPVYADNGDLLYINANGTASDHAYYLIAGITCDAGKNYYLSGCPNGGAWRKYRIYDDNNGVFSDYGSGVSIYADETIRCGIYIQIWSGVTVSNIAFKPMLNSGSTALPYEPYFEGLRSAPTEAVESVGVNLLPIERRTHTTNGITFVVNEDGSVTANGTATGNAYLNFLTPAVLTKGSYYANGGTTGNGMDKYSLQLYKVKEDGSIGEVYLQFVKDGGEGFTVSETQKVVGYIVVRTGVTVSNLTFYSMLTKGETAQPYRPFTRNTLPIPEAVQALDGYGWGVNESVYNYIDFEKKQYVQRVGKVDMGTLNWTISNGIFVSDEITNIRNGEANKAPNAICSKYEAVTMGAIAEKTCTISSGGKVWVIDSTYTDAATFKAAMSGVMLYYELATPEVTDISDILPADNYIGVEGGGTLTFKNEYEYDVPSEVTYITKGATV